MDILDLMLSCNLRFPHEDEGAAALVAALCFRSSPGESSEDEEESVRKKLELR